MNHSICVLLVIGAIIGAYGAPENYFSIPRPTFTRITPRGIRVSVPHNPGMSLVGIHYIINVPVTGVAAGQWNFDITKQTGGEWAHDNTQADVKDGDTIYYWILVIMNGEGKQLTDQSYKLQPPTTTSTTKRPTTPSTKPPTTHTTGTPTTRDPNATTPTPGPTTTGSGGGSSGGGGCGKCSGPDITPTCDKYPCIIFEDNFDTFDFTKWEHEITAGGGGNWEFQYYLNNRTNSYVKDGVLYMKPTLTEDRYGPNSLTSEKIELWGSAPPNLCTGNQFYGCMRQGTGDNPINPIQSARLRTVNTFNFKYGKLEIEAKMPAGDWIWPAIWMLPRREEYGIWPASGEIDIVEVRGNKNLRDNQGKSVGIDQMGATMHWGPYFGNNQYEKTHVTKNLPSGTYADDFHKYGVEWDEDNIKFFLDEELIMTVDPGSGGFWKFGEFDQRTPGSDNPWQYGEKMAPFDKEFYLIMNVAVGGVNYFKDTSTNSPSAKPWRNDSPYATRDFWNARAQWHPTWNPDKNNGEDAAMKIKYVKVWKLKP